MMCALVIGTLNISELKSRVSKIQTTFPLIDPLPSRARFNLAFGI